MIKAMVYIVLIVLLVVGLGSWAVYNVQGLIGKNNCIRDCMEEEDGYIEFSRIKYEIAYWSCFKACKIEG